jgi:transcriptional regulator with PAS, ATPase and Fis domain
LFVSRRITGENEAEDLAREVESWVVENLGLDYAWPGNIRELEQCVRNILIRRTYTPPEARRRTGREALAIAVREGRLSADELLRHYVTMVYDETGNYQETARRLGLDGRTVKSKVDPNLLSEYGTKK